MVIAKHLVVFLLWNIAAGAVLLTDKPAVGLPLAVGLYILLLWGYILKPLRESDAEAEDREDALRLRPLRGQALVWTLVSVPVVLLLSWVVGDVYSYFVSIPPESMNPFEPIMVTATGRLAIAVFAVGVAPIVEEFVFRGLIQSHIARNRGIATGVVVAAALFAAIHLLPHLFPLHLFLGVAFGFAVYATGSIWTGVILHAANNAIAMVGIAFAPTDEPEFATLWETGLTRDFFVSLLALAFAIGIAFWTGKKLLLAGRENMGATHPV